MLGQGRYLEEGLAPAGPVPVRQHLVAAKRRPLEDELQRPRFQAPGQQVSVGGNRGTSTCVVGMEMSDRVVALVPVHVDHHAVKGANPWHETTLAAPPK